MSLAIRPDHRTRLRSIGGSSRPATIDCGGARHRLSVRGGELHTHDHDATAELALHALGGGLPDCLVYALVWRQSFTDGFLEFFAEHEALDPLVRSHLRREWVDNYWEGWPPEPPAAAVLFEQPWQDALGAAVARSAAPGRRAAVHRAVQVRVRTAFVRSLADVAAHRKPDALVPLSVTVAPGPPAVTGRLAQTGSGVAIQVGAEWLWDVWAAGGSLVDGRLVLGRRGDAVACVGWKPAGYADGQHVPVITSGRPDSRFWHQKRG